MIRATRSAAQRGAALALVLTLGACGSWFGDKAPPPLPGTRVAVLTRGSEVRVDPSLSGTVPTIPAPAGFAEWPQPGGTPDHEGGNAPLSGTPRVAWSVSAGTGSSGSRLLLAQPVVAGGKVYVVDADYDVAAFDAASGRRLWSVSARSKQESDDVRGGGVTFADGRVFVSTGYAEVVALDAGNGAEVWRAKLPGPARSAPTVVGGRVAVITLDNQAVSLAAADGARQWAYSGILENAGLVGGAAPASDGTVLIAPFSSGEVVALRLENGRTVWGDSLASVRRGGAVSALADIAGLPVVSRGLVIAVSHGGRMAAIDLRTGGRAWEQDFGGTETPLVAGDEIYVVSAAPELIAMTRQQGRIRWIQPLDRFARPERRDTAIEWVGPVMAGNRLWLANSRGELLGIEPVDGTTAVRIPLPGPVRISPVVAGGTIYVLTDGGQLVALR